MPFGGPELMYILLIVLVLFGGAKIPQLMKGLGEGMREFRNASNEDDKTTTTVATPPSTSTPNTTAVNTPPNNAGNNNTPTHV
jgi:sec-independent protein translocase protein TatA